MAGLFESDALWLTLVNCALGLAVLVSLFVFGRAVIQELRHRAAERKRLTSTHTSGNLDLKSLGITLPDGGEPVNELKRIQRKKDPDDPPNIVRSDD